MSLIVRIMDNLNDCRIGVKVGDITDSQDDGILTVFITGQDSMTRTVKLGFPPQIIHFDETPKTGHTHTITARLITQSERNEDFDLLRLC